MACTLLFVVSAAARGGAGGRTERRDERPGGGRPDHARPHHRHLHQGVRRDQPVRRHVAADGDRLCRPEETRNTAERAQDHVDLPHRRRGEEQQHQPGADQIARHERRLQRPAIDEHARQRTEHRQRQHVGDLDTGDLARRPVHAIGDDADHGEQRQEVAEQAHHLRVPHAPHHRQPQHVAKRHRHGGNAGFSGHGGGRDHTKGKGFKRFKGARGSRGSRVQRVQRVQGSPFRF